MILWRFNISNDQIEKKQVRNRRQPRNQISQDNPGIRFSVMVHCTLNFCDKSATVNLSSSSNVTNISSIVTPRKPGETYASAHIVEYSMPTIQTFNINTLFNAFPKLLIKFPYFSLISFAYRSILLYSNFKIFCIEN